MVKRHALLIKNELNTADQIKTATNKLIQVLNLALKLTGRPAHNYRQDSTWWNKEYKAALHIMQQAKEEKVNNSTFAKVRKIYQKTI